MTAGTTVLGKARSIDRVQQSQRLGRDEQVDDKSLIIAPDPANTDPFLLLAEDWFSTPGFDWHPHRGIETVTFVVDGVLEHGDNVGRAGALQAGDVQWMTAGKGIIHRELAFRDEHVHTLQLWLNLPAALKMVPAGYQDLLAGGRPRLDAPGVHVDVLSGNVAGTTGPARNQHPVQAAALTMEPGSSFDYPLPSDHRAFVHLLEGAVTAGGRAVSVGEVAWSDPVGTAGASHLLLNVPDGDTVTRLLAFSGRPLREPVAFGGPFVMNSRAEIGQAFRDFHAGSFGSVPRRARLTRAG